MHPVYRFSAVALQLALITGALPAFGATGQSTVNSADQPYGSAQTAHVQALVDVKVARGTNPPIDAALVPALQQGDVITIRFPGFERPAARYRFHANYAIVSGQGATWMDPNGDGLHLFDDSTDGAPANKVCDSTVDMHGGCNALKITYGGVGTPVVFLMVEDSRTRGMVGIRDDVNADPGSYLNTSIIAADATVQESWMENFISSLGTGAVGVGATGQGNVMNAVTRFGVAQTDASGCYTSHSGDKEGIGKCLIALIQQRNVTQFDGSSIGALVGAAIPLHLSPYVAGLSLIFSFVSKSRTKTNYEYLPSSLLFVNPDVNNGIQGGQYLDVPTAPLYEPPKGKNSDVLFFPIGAFQSNPMKNAPKIVEDSEFVCASDKTTSIPLHLDQSSPYVHDASMIIDDPANPSKTISEPVSNSSITPLTIQTTELQRTELGHAKILEARLQASYGFASMITPVFSIALPDSNAAWSASGPNGAPLPSHQKTTVLLSGPDAPCASELVVPTSNGQKSYKVNVKDATHATADDVVLPPGNEINATVVLKGQSALQSTVAIKPNLPLPIVETPRTYVGDHVIFLQGKRVNLIQSIKDVTTGTLYKIAGPHITGTADCFSAASSPGSLTEGSPETMQITAPEGSFTENFDVLDSRPPTPTVTDDRAIADALVPTLPSNTFGSNDYVHISVNGVDFINGHRTIRVRVKPDPNSFASSLCAALAPVNAKDYADLMPSHPSTTGADVYFRPVDALRDRAVGTLQIAVFDEDLHALSDWVDVPGTFVAVPSIDHIGCANGDCAVYGHNLSFAQGIGDGTSVVPLIKPCASSQLSTDHSLECASIGQLSKFILYLGSGGNISVTVPAKLVAAQSNR